MICKYMDMTGHALHEGDTVLLDKPGADGKVIGTLEFHGRRGMWAVKVEKVFSASQQQFIPVNCGAISQHVSLAPHMRLFSKELKGVELLREAPRAPRRPWDYPAPGIY